MLNAESLTVVICAGVILLLATMLYLERKDNRREQRHLVTQLMSLMDLQEMPTDEEQEQNAKTLREVTSQNRPLTRSTGSSVNFKMPPITHPPVRPLGND